MSEYLPDSAVRDALSLACAVREYDEYTVARILADTHLPSTVVALACMVDIDRTPSDLLAWNDRLVQGADDIGLRPHGTHAAFNRHRIRDEQPCAACRYGERIYQRHRVRRAAVAS